MYDTPYKIRVFPKMRILISEYLRRSRIKNNVNLFVEADVGPGTDDDVVAFCAGFAFADPNGCGGGGPPAAPGPLKRVCHIY